MEQIFELIGEVGAPIAGSIVMGFFIFTVIKQILEGVVDSIGTQPCSVSRLRIVLERCLTR